MTAPELYSHRELLELAALDAFGLLDEFESDLFNRSFHHASVPLQEQIRRLQAEITSDELLLPDEEPSRALRQRVLSAVARAIEADDARYQPIARIGRMSAEAGARRRLGGSGQFWRAAAFVLAGVSVTMAYFLADTIDRSHDVYWGALLDDTAKLQSILGATMQDFMLDESVKVSLEPLTDDSVEAALYVNTVTGKVGVLTNKLPRTQQDGYALRVVFEDGTMEQVGTFASTGSLTPNKFDLTSNVVASVSTLIWQVTDLATGRVLLTSAA